MEYIIYPYSGFRCVPSNICINLGMTSNEIANLLGRVSNDVVSALEYFDDFRIDYDDKCNASAFEFFNSSKLYIGKECRINLFDNIDLFSIKFGKLNKAILEIDNSARCDGAGVISLKLGLGTYHEDSEDDICESIIIFKKGYYDSLGWK